MEKTGVVHKKTRRGGKKNKRRQRAESRNLNDFISTALSPPSGAYVGIPISPTRTAEEKLQEDAHIQPETLDAKVRSRSCLSKLKREVLKEREQKKSVGTIEETLEVGRSIAQVASTGVVAVRKNSKIWGIPKEQEEKKQNTEICKTVDASPSGYGDFAVGRNFRVERTLEKREETQSGVGDLEPLKILASLPPPSSTEVYRGNAIRWEVPTDQFGITERPYIYQVSITEVEALPAIQDSLLERVHKSYGRRCCCCCNH